MGGMRVLVSWTLVLGIKLLCVPLCCYNSLFLLCHWDRCFLPGVKQGIGNASEFVPLGCPPNPLSKSQQDLYEKLQYEWKVIIDCTYYRVLSSNLHITNNKYHNYLTQCFRTIHVGADLGNSSAVFTENFSPFLLQTMLLNLFLHSVTSIFNVTLCP